jgi:hypothetical protein|tara:strand:+ start:2344 stop:2820 length:477 start_codon:yes stop_codon:yes gene_type:complete
MKKIINKFTTFALVTLVSVPVFGQIFNKQKKTASYYSVETECLEDKLDGSFILQAWGKGSSKSEAIDQAKRNVLNDVLFKGVNKGCQMRPLIVEVNASTKYKSYVYSFFNSDYKDFISIEKSPKSLKKSRKQTSYGIKVRVKVEAIRKKLITDNILKQ